MRCERANRRAKRARTREDGRKERREDMSDDGTCLAGWIGASWSRWKVEVQRDTKRRKHAVRYLISDSEAQLEDTDKARHGLVKVPSPLIRPSLLVSPIVRPKLR